MCRLPVTGVLRGFPIRGESPAAGLLAAQITTPIFLELMQARDGASLATLPSDTNRMNEKICETAIIQLDNGPGST